MFFCQKILEWVRRFYLKEKTVNVNLRDYDIMFFDMDPDLTFIVHLFIFNGRFFIHEMKWAENKPLFTLFKM